MGYPVITDFETGPHVAAWEHAIEAEQRGEVFSLAFESKERADAFRYRMHATRANAEKQKHDLGEQTKHFMLRIVLVEGRYVLQAHPTKGVLGDVDLRTKKERERDAELARQAEEMRRRLAAVTPEGTAPMDEAQAKAVFRMFQLQGRGKPEELRQAAQFVPELRELLDKMDRQKAA